MPTMSIFLLNNLVVSINNFTMVITWYYKTCFSAVLVYGMEALWCNYPS